MRPYEWLKSTVMAFGFECNLDQEVIMRETDTILDVLADVGGFAEVLGFTCALILEVFNHRYLEQVLASKLFNEASPSEDKKLLGSKKRTHGDLEVRELYVPKKWACCRFLIDCFGCRRISCCKRSRRLEATFRARKALKREIDIVELIRVRRYVYALIDKLFDPLDRVKFLRFHSFVTIDPDEMRRSFLTIRKSGEPLNKSVYRANDGIKLQL